MNITKLSDRLFKIIRIMIAIFLAVMISLVFMNVVLRYVFTIGFVWSEEIARLSFIFIVYLGSIEAMRDNRHLLIDTVLLKTPKPVQITLYALTQIIVIWMMIVLTRGAWALVLQNRYNVWIATGFPSFVVHFFGCIVGASVAFISGINLFRLFVLKVPVSELIKVRNDDVVNDESTDDGSIDDKVVNSKVIQNH